MCGDYVIRNTSVLKLRLSQDSSSHGVSKIHQAFLENLGTISKENNAIGFLIRLPVAVCGLPAGKNNLHIPPIITTATNCPIISFIQIH